MFKNRFTYIYIFLHPHKNVTCDKRPQTVWMLVPLYRLYHLHLLHYLFCIFCVYHLDDDDDDLELSPCLRSGQYTGAALFPRAAS